MAQLTAQQLHEQYHDLLQQPPFSDAPTPYRLHQALVQRGINVTHQVCKTWWNKYRISVEVSVKSAKELDEKYSHIVKPLAVENRTAHKLCAAMREHDPPVYVTDGVAKRWLEMYFGPMQNIEIAGHLETLYGKRLRAADSIEVLR